MPYRKIIHATGEIYHIFNRGVNRMDIFSSVASFSRFIDLMEYYHFANTRNSFSNFKRRPAEEREEIMDELYRENELRVEIFAFCLMNNHFHILARQVAENGVGDFTRNIQNAYAKYYNLKSNRSGPLFQPMFKSVRIEDENQLLHVSRYIHLNPSTGHLVSIKNLPTFPWSSLSCYTDNSYEFPFIDTELILGMLNKNKYKYFIYNQAEYQRELHKIKHLTLE